MADLSRAVRLRINTHAWALLVLVIIQVMTNFLSENLTIGRLTPSEALMPHRQFYDLWRLMVFVILLAAILFWLVNHGRRVRVAIFLLNGVFTAQLFVATLLIVARLLQSQKVVVGTLLVDGFIILVTNILVFSLWYWYIDSSNTRFLETEVDRRWDFLFPQRQETYPGYEDWQPRFWDYLFLAYTTSVAFSPTETAPLSRAAKVLMMTQSTIALIAITAVVGTAINILAGNA
jgi:hypothetical protein